MERTQTARAARGNYVSEWFGHRVYPLVVTSDRSVDEQRREICPFLSEVTGEERRCIKPAASRGVCTVNTPHESHRRDWLVCPYRAFDPALLNTAIRRLFGFPENQAALVLPAIRLEKESERSRVREALASGGRVFVYFDAKLGGELSISRTAMSPELSFDITVIEIESSDDLPGLGRFGIVEVQTMDFHGSYKHVVTNLKDALRLHPNNFPDALSTNQHWLSEKIEGPNLSNVFKRTFYQMMFKFQLGQSSRCAGCVLAIPRSVWQSWQRHLGGPELSQEIDGTFSLFEPGRGRPENVAAWIYAFELDSDAATTPSPVTAPLIIATDAAAMSYFALEKAPANALATLDSPAGMIGQLERRLVRLWPELGRALAL